MQSIMKAELRFFEVYPKVVPANTNSKISITPLLGEVDFSQVDHLQVTVVSRDSVTRLGLAVPVEIPAPVEFQLVDGSILIDMFFADESEYAFRLNCSSPGGSKSYSFRIYSLCPDLFRLRPFKGDFHIHSLGSDGKETPGYVAASCRKIGFDFMALTDHHTQQPSIDAINAMLPLNTAFKCYSGEEIHPPDNPAHIINFGGSLSVSQYCREQPQEYRAAVNAIAATLTAVPPEISFQVASCEWCFEMIRHGGGLAVFSHPYWETGDRFYLSETLMTHIFKRHKFDAFELVGGYYPREMESNNLQLVRYIEERAAGNDFPVVGVSDAHGCDCGELFGWYYTVVLAESPQLPDLIAAIKSFNAVAVDAVSGGPRVAVYGHLRIVKYVNFLLREYFPLHDQICAREGKLMIDYLAGNPDSAAKISRCSKEISQLMQNFWHGSEA
jgi:predicted metal-dependent phosphoesterase TrpH